MGEPLLRQAAKRCVDWFEQMFPARLETHVQSRLELRDVDSGSILTEGTPDLWCVVDGGPLVGTTTHVVDWKKIEQLFAGKLPNIGDDWQLKLYLFMAMAKSGAARGQYHRVCWSDEELVVESSQVFHAKECRETYQSVLSAPDVDPSGPKPEARKGDHCSRCYRRQHCHAYMLPDGPNTPAALVPLTLPKDLNQVEAEKALAWLESAERTLKVGAMLVESVEAKLEAHASVHGPIFFGDRRWGAKESPGKRSGPKLDELEKLGMAHLIKPAKPSITYGWIKK